MAHALTNHNPIEARHKLLALRGDLKSFEQWVRSMRRQYLKLGDWAAALSALEIYKAARAAALAKGDGRENR